MKAGMELHEEENGAIDLPSHITKRKLYELWVCNRGWRVTSDNKVSYPPMAKWLAYNQFLVRLVDQNGNVHLMCAPLVGSLGSVTT
jgi:hypothetical protein